MKRLLTNLLTISAIGLLMLSSCKKNDAVVTATSGKPGTLTASATSLILSKADTTATPIITFSFTNSNFGYKGAVVTNTLQIDTIGDNWAKPVVQLTLGTNVNTQSYTTAQLNTMALTLFKTSAGKVGQFNVRIVQTLGTAVTPIYSNIVVLSVTPYSTVIPETFLYVVGAYQGWSLSARDSLASKDGNIYTGIIDFTTGNNQFLILPDAGDYNNKYATNDSSTPSATVAVGANNNLTAPATAGNYLITLNLSAKTITFVLANSYSVIGDAALGWNGTGDDSEMKYINDGSGNWVVTLPLVSTGAFKVRENDDWTFSWGIPQSGAAGDGTPLTLNDTKNNNITVATSGTYRVLFNEPASAQSPSFTPLVTTTYSVTASK